jgi:hypothetical protein
MDGSSGGMANAAGGAAGDASGTDAADAGASGDCAAIGKDKANNNALKARALSTDVLDIESSQLAAVIRAAWSLPASCLP